MAEANTAPSPAEKPEGKVNISGTARWALRQMLGGKRGNLVIAFLESFTPSQLESFLTDFLGRVGAKP